MSVPFLYPCIIDVSFIVHCQLSGRPRGGPGDHKKHNAAAGNAGNSGNAVAPTSTAGQQGVPTADDNDYEGGFED